MKVLRRYLQLLPYRKGAECFVRGRSVVVLHQLGDSAFVKTIDTKADQWTAWISQSELADGW